MKPTSISRRNLCAAASGLGAAAALAAPAQARAQAQPAWPAVAQDGDRLRVTRHFLALPTREVLFRRAGQGRVPLIMFHAQPGSSKQMEWQMKALAPTRAVLALDTPGNGDSSPLAKPDPTIADYAVAALEVLDTLKIDRFDVYGSHTGADIAAELAMLAPNRVRKVVQDGIAVFPPQTRAYYLENYAKPFPPDLDGAYLMHAFMYVRDMYSFWPWFERTKAARLDSGLPSAANLHAQLIEVLKNPTTYHLGYRAAFSYDPAARLPLVKQPVLAVASEQDPLGPDTKTLVESLPGGNGRYRPLPPYAAPDFQTRYAAIINDFLGPDA